MKGMELIDLLNTFKAVEEDTDSITVLGDDEAMRVLAAWKRTDQKWSRPKTKMPTMQAGNHAAVWAWICEGWIFDNDGIARGADLSLRVVHVKIRMLILARLIYPDGSVSKAARAALQVHVAQKLGIKPKRSKESRGGNKAGEGESTN